MGNPFRTFVLALEANARTSARSMVVAGALGTIIFGAYGVLWLYVTPLAHESLKLRLLGMSLCLGLWLSPHWPGRYKKGLPWLWFAAVTYALPFFSTYQLLASNYSLLRSMLEVATVFFVIVIFPNHLLAISSMLIGIGLGAVAAYFALPDFWALNHAIVKTDHLPAIIYSVVAGMIFTRSHLKSQLVQEKIDAMKALIGSIAHEMKSPMDHLSQRLNAIGKRLPDHAVGVQSQTIYVDDLEAIYAELSKCKEAIERTTQVVTLTTDEISAKPVDVSRHRYLQATTVVNKALAEFGYTNPGDRDRISVAANSDFIFKGDETRVIFTLFNLLKNALYYFDRYPDARVTIKVEERQVTVEDTGPGIRSEDLPRLFEAFQTWDKPDGTGLGLSFCQRTMRALGGSIHCESEHGKFTRFVLRFPALAKDELSAHERDVMTRGSAMFNGKRVLVVDDSRHFRQMSKKVLVRLGAVVDEAEDGKQALAMLAALRHEAMVLDLQMPELDGYATAERVRRGAIAGLEHLTIVALSSESPHAARVRLERIGVKEFLSKGCSPLELIEVLCRAHATSKAQAKTAEDGDQQAGKTILLVDDDEFTRKYIRTTLMTQGFQVLEAADAEAALQLWSDAARQIDAVITDIHMPHMSGVDMVRALRAGPRPLGAMPVIAMSSRTDDAMQSEAREAGVNAFVPKPVQVGDLLLLVSQRLAGSANGKQPGSPTAPKRLPAAPLPLIDLARLDSLRRLGMNKVDITLALEELHTKVGQLANYVEAKDLERAKMLMHALMGLAGHLGASALYEEVHEKYTTMLATGQWPAQVDWLKNLSQLFADTHRMLKARAGA